MKISRPGETSILGSEFKKIMYIGWIYSILGHNSGIRQYQYKEISSLG
jgi:hypothetical protein